MNGHALECDVLIIGAGVVGLAVGAELASRFSTILVEAKPQFGQETSSRNSEVIHSGVYYPPHSLKTELCLRGRALLYEFCDRFQVPHRKTGKFLVATSESEESYLETRAIHCKEVGAPFRRVTGEEIVSREPAVVAKAGIFFSETGIVDSHQLMARLEQQLTDRGATLAYRHRVTAVEAEGDGYGVHLVSGGEELSVRARVVVNCAGLAAAEISNLALKSSRYEHRYCRGRYFGVSGACKLAFQSLIYPVPPKDGLGIHVTVDLTGAIRLGPDVDWCLGVPYSGLEKLYDCDWEELRPVFAEAARRYIPSLQTSHLQPHQIGVRPKLFVDATPLPDFLIENHNGFVQCLGIESPGLTASLAIAERVSKLI